MVFSKETNIRSRIKNPDLDFSKETHPESSVSISQAERGVHASALALATSCSATFCNFCYLDQLSGNVCHLEQFFFGGGGGGGLGRILSNFNQKSCIIQFKSCYISLLQNFGSQPCATRLPRQLEYPVYEVHGSQRRPCFSKMATSIEISESSEEQISISNSLKTAVLKQEN